MLNTEFMLTVGLPSITGNIVGERKAAQDFYNKYDIERMPAEKREKFYKALNNGMGLKKELAWGTGRLAAQGAGVLAGIGITDELISRYAPEYEDNDLLRGLSTGVIGAAPVSYLASKMYTNAIARNAVDKSGIKPNIREDEMKIGSWANGYTKEELCKIAACAKKEKDAANVFDLDNANNNITSSKFRTIEQSQNINKIIPKYQRKGGIIPAPKTVNPNLSGLVRKA